MLCFGLFWFGERERGDVEFWLLPGKFAIGGEGMETGEGSVIEETRPS